jgi:hypothetical protein
MADIDKPQARADDQPAPASSLTDRLFTELNDRFISAAQLRLLEAGASPQAHERALIDIEVTAFDMVASMAVRAAQTDEAADQCRAQLSEAAVAVMTHSRTQLQGMRPDFFADLRLALSSRVHYWGAEALRVARERAMANFPGRTTTDVYRAEFSRWLRESGLTTYRIAKVSGVDRKTARKAMNGDQGVTPRALEKIAEGIRSHEPSVTTGPPRS